MAVGSEWTFTQKWWRFVATGLIINGALFGLLWLLLNWGVDYRIAATVTFVTGILWGYTQNRLWSWKSDVPVMRSTLRYFAVYGVVYFVHMGLVMSLVEIARFPPIVAALASVAVLIVPNFMAVNALVFRRPSV